MELQAATTTSTDDEKLIDSTHEYVNDSSWMSSLPEISTLDYSPQSTATAITFGPQSGKKARTELASLGNDNSAADLNENDVPPNSA